MMLLIGFGKIGYIMIQSAVTSANSVAGFFLDRDFLAKITFCFCFMVLFALFYRDYNYSSISVVISISYMPFS